METVMRTRRTPARSIGRHAPSGLLPWLLLALLLFAAAPAAWAQTLVGNGHAASEPRTVAAFNAIASSGGLALRVRQGSPAAVTVHGDANLLPMIEAVVDANQTLQLRWQRGLSVRTTARTWVDVVAPQVEAVSGAGSGGIRIDTMKVPRLALAIKGSADLDVKDLRTEALQVSVSGSGDVELAGQATRVAIELSGSGEVDADDLHADEVTIGIRGSGGVGVHASRKLVASIAGSGHVRYRGEPSVQQSIAGSGSVRKR
jgi:hypothetical protein